MNRQLTGSLWLPALTFLLLWADLFRNLSLFWSTNPQYAYGWTVPALSAFLLWEAWVTRPAPGGAAASGLVKACMVLLAAMILPARLLLEVTPDWRLAHWALGFGVSGLSLAAVYLLGGRPWLRHLAFPILFSLVAAPWPTKIEQPFIQSLSAWVADATVNGLNICDVPALKHGNIIEISRGAVEVEDACSGVRSFQATFMSALFLGQLWNFTLGYRVVLLVAGLIFAFLCNIVRALLLAMVADRHGLAAIDRWHDPAGFTILGVTFIGLLGLALLLREKAGRVAPLAAEHPPRRLPGGVVAALAGWVLCVAVGTEVWYRTGTILPAAWWRVEWPENKPAFAEIAMTDRVVEMAFDLGRQAKWKEDDGSEWTMFFFRWLPGDAASRILARWHNPEQCLVSIGFQRIAEYEPLIVKKGAIELVFRTFRFEVAGVPTFVFFCVWEDRRDPGGPKAPEEWNPRSRVRAVLDRKRRLGQQVLEIAITGVDSDKTARAAFERRIPELLQPDSIMPTLDTPSAAAAAGGK